MIHSFGFGFFGLNIGWGIVNLILASKLAEYRLDDVSRDGGMGRDLASLASRLTASNYSPAGQRLLPLARLSFVAQGVALFVWVFFFAV